MTTAGRDVM